MHIIQPAKNGKSFRSVYNYLTVVWNEAFDVFIFISIALVLNSGPYVPAGTNRLGEWVLNLHNAGYIFQKWVGNYSKSLTV